MTGHEGRLARPLMVVGTHSSAGKSLLVTALCRIFAQDGWLVAPFKAQNMALNAFATREGHEIGRAQASQAEAAGIEPHVDMNPILLKPEGSAASQVVLDGRPWGRLQAGSFYKHKAELWPHVTGALDRLRRRYDLVIIEGAGSPAEINLRAGDIVNMRVARYANAPTLLVGDIDRGGVFAALVGTMVLLEPEERALIKAFVINKFRGDVRLLGDGLELLKQRAFGTPTLGVIPFLPDLQLADEDGVALDRAPRQVVPGAQVDIAVVRVPHPSNFDDFDPLAAEPGVSVRWLAHPDEWGQPDAVILPGTKTTLADLAWLREQGLASHLEAHARAGGAVVGICGGFQMLGGRISDPHGTEAPAGSDVPALGLLPVETVFAPGKETTQTVATVLAGPCVGARVRGYEIHAGHSTGGTPLLRLTQRGLTQTQITDGAVSPDGRIWGCYLHGLFDNAAFRRAWLRSLGWQPPDTAGHDIGWRAAEYDRLAAHVRAHLDMELLYRIIEGEPTGGLRP